MRADTLAWPFQYDPGQFVYARVSPGRELLSNSLVSKDEPLSVIDGYRNDAGFPIYRLWSPGTGEIELAQVYLSSSPCSG